MIWTPHTPIFGLKTILALNWTTKLKKSGQNRPFGALAAEMEAQYIPVSTYKEQGRADPAVLWNEGEQGQRCD